MPKTTSGKPRPGHYGITIRPGVQDSETGHRWLTEHRLAILNTIALRARLLESAFKNLGAVCKYILRDLERVGGPHWAKQWKELRRKREREAKGL